MINRDEDHIITCDYKPFVEFACQIIDNSRVHVVPRLWLGQKAGDISYLIKILKLKYGRHPYDKIKLLKNAIFYSDHESIEYFIVLKRLIESNMNIYHCNVYDEISETLPKEYYTVKRYLEALILSLCTGFRVDFRYIRQNKIVMPHLLNGEFNLLPQPMPLTWNELALKFNVLPDLKTESSILIVDGPLDGFEGVDIKSSLDNITKIIKNIMSSGKKVYVKPHYLADYTSFDNCDISSRLIILPNSFPAPLIIPKFKEIYFFTSASVKDIEDWQDCYSFSRQMVFKDEKFKKTFEDIMCFATENAYSKIKFI